MATTSPSGAENATPTLHGCEQQYFIPEKTPTTTLFPFSFEAEEMISTAIIKINRGYTHTHTRTHRFLSKAMHTDPL